MTATRAVNTHTSIAIIYDGDCPVCKRYMQLLNIRESFADVQLINARDKQQALVIESRRKGCDLNQGFILNINNKFYYGSEALQQLALISSNSRAFNRFNAWLFSSSLISRLSYPLLVKARLLLLWILRRKPIQQ